MRTIECEECGFACTEDRSKDYIREVDIKDKDGRDECKIVCIDCAQKYRFDHDNR